jgi:sulfatase maturation enzyme AslB (radical SAM superfamily)
VSLTENQDHKSTYDDLLIKLFEASVYSKFSKVSVQNLEELHLNYFESEFENIILLIWQEWHFGVMED